MNGVWVCGFFRSGTEYVRAYETHPRYQRLVQTLEGVLLIDLCNLVYAFVRPPMSNEIMHFNDFQPSDPDCWRVELLLRPLMGRFSDQMFPTLFPNRVFQMEGVFSRLLYGPFGNYIELRLYDSETILKWEEVYDAVCFFILNCVKKHESGVDVDAISFKPPYRVLSVPKSDHQPASTLPSRPQTILFRLRMPKDCLVPYVPHQFPTVIPSRTDPKPKQETQTDYCNVKSLVAGSKMSILFQMYKVCFDSDDDDNIRVYTPIRLLAIAAAPQATPSTS